jgi:hypothetical protein
MTRATWLRFLNALSRLACTAVLVQLAAPLVGHAAAPFGPWTQQSPTDTNPFPARANLLGGVYTEGRYWVVGSGTRSSSTDGELWTDVGVEHFYGSAIAAGPAGLVTTGGSVGDFYYSSTGEVWARGDVREASSVYLDVVYDDGRFIAVGGEIASSTDGRTWRIVWNAESRFGFCGIVRGATEWVAVNGVGRTLWSRDGETWQEGGRAEGLCTGVTFGNGRYVVVSVFSGIYVSADGITWQRHDFPRAADDGAGVADLCDGRHRRRWSE